MSFLQIVGAFFIFLFSTVGATFIGYCTWIGLRQVWTQIKGSPQSVGMASTAVGAPDSRLGAVGGE